MKKKTSEMTIAELRARAAEIRTEVNAEGADLDALEAEADEISQRIAQYETEQRRLGIAAKVADGAGAPQDNPTAHTDAQTRAQQFKENRRAVLGVEETRAVLVSGGKLATPTEVNTEIQDRVGVGVSSIIDMVWVDDCSGMSTDRIPYVKQDADAAADQTEGAAATTKEATYDYIDITPKSEAVLSQISKQAKKLTPVNYFNKCRAQALLSLRKKASAIVTDALKASKLVDTIDATLDSAKKGVINEKTLRNLTLNYGGDEAVEGEAVLFLNKKDLVAFGDVRGTNEKKYVYEITPDSANPNTGIIKEGGLSVRYCLNKNLTACAGTAQTAKAQPTMFYGVPRCLKLDLFSDYEIAVSDDFAFDKLLSTIRGDVEMGADVVVPGGFVALTIAANA